MLYAVRSSCASLGRSDLLKPMAITKPSYSGKKPKGSKRWPHERPHMNAIDKQKARAILCEVQRVFDCERIEILAGRAHGLKAVYSRAAAIELFPWSIQSTGSYFGINRNTVRYTRKIAADRCDIDPE